MRNPVTEVVYHPWRTTSQCSWRPIPLWKNLREVRANWWGPWLMSAIAVSMRLTRHKLDRCFKLEGLLGSCPVMTPQGRCSPRWKMLTCKQLNWKPKNKKRRRRRSSRRLKLSPPKSRYSRRIVTFQILRRITNSPTLICDKSDHSISFIFKQSQVLDLK